MKTKIELTETENDCLKIIIASELKRKNDELARANAYATFVDDPDLPTIMRIWEKINGA